MGPGQNEESGHCQHIMSEAFIATETKPQKNLKMFFWILMENTVHECCMRYKKNQI